MRVAKTIELNDDTRRELRSLTRSRVWRFGCSSAPVNVTHRSTRTLAEHLGLGATTVRRVWHSFGLKPHLSRGFKLR